METSTIIALSQAKVNCLQTISNIGSSKIVNICTGQINVIPWGSGDWILVIFLGLFGISILGIFVFLIKMMISEL